MTRSHLYAGFKFAGKLQSVEMQRRLQAGLVAMVPSQKLLTVGCGYGEELKQLLGGLKLDDPDVDVTAIDIADVRGSLQSYGYARQLGERFRYGQLDLIGLEQLSEFGNFDIIQCGFVLHDISWSFKDKAISSLGRAVHAGGYQIISDIFVATGVDKRSEATLIYDRFLREADASRRAGTLSDEGWNELVGDGESPGLRRSKREAVAGDRDFFDTLPDMLERAKRCELQVCRVIENPVNDRLAVVLMRWPGPISNGSRG